VLRDLAAARGLEIYLVGGSVRELALGRQAPDLDLAVSAQTLDLARELAAALNGTFVLLDEKERTARVVNQEDILDLAEFRAPGLEGDLQGRDFTINALALDLKEILGAGPLRVIDPLGGLADLSRGLIRMVAAENLAADPLRLLRAYRFAATHGFSLTPETEAAIRRLVQEFSRVAGERVHQELFTLLGVPAAGPILAQMDRVGLLLQIFPELEDLKGVEQNGYHHLDVFHHSLAAVYHLEEVLAAPLRYFGDLGGELVRYAGLPSRSVLLKLAALFHDAGKPRVKSRRTDPDRFTFYYHEKVGIEIFAGVVRRLRLSTAETRLVTTLIQLHMRPFLLLAAFRERELSFRALGRLVRAARHDLPGLFALAMADSLAGQGPQKPADAEEVLADLADEAYHFLKERLEPQERLPRLISGHDLIGLGLTPGPRFRQILTAVEEAQWEGAAHTREDALRLARRLLE
jgi:poly(A) polymerase